MSILLIRHGETDGNRLRIVQRPEMPLNDNGLGQAERLAARLSQEPVTRLLSSPLRRAEMTAEAVSRALEIETELEPLLEERNFGDIRGTAYEALGFDPMGETYEPPGGESWPVFLRRAELAWTRVVELAAETSGSLAVVTHGLVCAAFARFKMSLSPGEVAPERWGNTSLSIFDKRSPWRVRLLNCTRHLDLQSADDAASRSGL